MRSFGARGMSIEGLLSCAQRLFFVAHLPGAVVNRAFFLAEKTPDYVFENLLQLKTASQKRL
jgi:hypothetical protein